MWVLSSLTRDRTCAPALQVWSLNHWTTARESSLAAVLRSLVDMFMCRMVKNWLPNMHVPSCGQLSACTVNKSSLASILCHIFYIFVLLLVILVFRCPVSIVLRCCLMFLRRPGCA